LILQPLIKIFPFLGKKLSATPPASLFIHLY
jgi:hypothetical protein